MIVWRQWVERKTAVELFIRNTDQVERGESFVSLVLSFFSASNLEDYQTLICRVDNAPVCLLSSDGLWPFVVVWKQIAAANELSSSKTSTSPPGVRDRLNSTPVQQQQPRTETQKPGEIRSRFFFSFFLSLFSSFAQSLEVNIFIPIVCAIDRRRRRSPGTAMHHHPAIQRRIRIYAPPFYRLSARLCFRKWRRHPGSFRSEWVERERKAAQVASGVKWDLPFFF